VFREGHEFTRADDWREVKSARLKAVASRVEVSSWTKPGETGATATKPLFHHRYLEMVEQSSTGRAWTPVPTSAFNLP